MHTRKPPRDASWTVSQLTLCTYTASDERERYHCAQHTRCSKCAAGSNRILSLGTCLPPILAPWRCLNSSTLYPAGIWHVLPLTYRHMRTRANIFPLAFPRLSSPIPLPRARASRFLAKNDKWSAHLTPDALTVVTKEPVGSNVLPFPLAYCLLP